MSNTPTILLIVVCLAAAGCGSNETPTPALELQIGMQVHQIDAQSDNDAVLAEVMRHVEGNWIARGKSGTDWIQFRSILQTPANLKGRDATFASIRSTDYFRISTSSGLTVVEIKRDGKVEQKGSTNTTDWNAVRFLITNSPLNDTLMQNILHHQHDPVAQAVR